MGSIKDLLGDTPFPEMKSPAQLTRRADPATSFAAASSVVKKLRPIQEKVLAELRAAGAAGLTDLELEERCGSHGSTFRTRRSELVDAGLVRDSGVKRHQAGSNRIVWVASQQQAPSDG
jgi:hypothetical protein